MTEAEWLSTVDHPLDMFEFLEGDLLQPGSSLRRWHLYWCACYRQIWDQMPEAGRRTKFLVEIRERSIDGLASRQEFRDAGGTLQRDRYFNHAVRAAEAVAMHNGRDYRLACELLRDIFGNPFRPVMFASGWRSTIVTSLAETIYTTRAFDHLPILADALEDAGCTDRDILDHCRSGGEHVRGCWVVDLVLGKE